MTVRVLGRGHYPAKRVEDLRPGDVIMRRSGRAHVQDVTIGIKSVFLRLTGRDIAYAVNIHRRRGSLVAIVLTPRSRAFPNPRGLAAQKKQPAYRVQVPAGSLI